jgi:hypothetical protein
MADSEPHKVDLCPADELQRKYGLYAENRRLIYVDLNEVPAGLRDLIPYVERWAIPCDITRHDYFDKQPEADVREFARIVGRREKEVDAWLDSVQSNWPKAGYQFMYLLKAWSEAACEFPEEA